MEYPEGEPPDAQEPVEPRRQPPGRSDPRVVDPEETVDLESSVPDAPEEHDQRNAVQTARGEAKRRGREDERGHEEAGAEALEERAVSVRAHHSREVVAEGPESGDQEADGVCGLPALERRRRAGRSGSEWRSSSARSRTGPNTHSLLRTAAVLSLAKVFPVRAGIYQVRLRERRSSDRHRLPPGNGAPVAIRNMAWRHER